MHIFISILCSNNGAIKDVFYIMNFVSGNELCLCEKQLI